MESELFGYTEGAFTGARHKGKVGLVKRADGGTLFLDEIGDLSLDLQSKLLHVLEKREFLSVGAVESTRVDVRFIAATNADLAQRIAADRFRRDLYYRLNVATLRIPPLRERREDILPLARHFVQKSSQEYDKVINGIAADAEQWLEAQSWPGNVRQLRNAIERAVLLQKSDTLGLHDLQSLTRPDDCGAPDAAFQLNVMLGTGDDVIHQVTREVLVHAYERSDGNQSLAARLLGIPRTTFQTYLQRFDL